MLKDVPEERKVPIKGVDGLVMQKQSSRTPIPDSSPADSFSNALPGTRKNKGLLSESSEEIHSSSDDEGVPV